MTLSVTEFPAFRRPDDRTVHTMRAGSPRQSVSRSLGAVLAIVLVTAIHASAQTVLIDGFERTDGWTPVGTEGSFITLGNEPGVTGNALALDIEMHGGYSWVGVRKELDRDLPPDFALSFDIRGTMPSNNLEIKLSDTLDNVFWVKKLRFSFPGEWTRLRYTRQHFRFAWGPSGGGDLRRVKTIELVVSAAQAGSGTVWFDNLALETLRQTGATQAGVSVSSVRDGTLPPVMRGDTMTAWRSAITTQDDTVACDFGRTREWGGMTIDWDTTDFAANVQIASSPDGVQWETIFTAADCAGGRCEVPTPAAEGRFLRLNLNRSSRGRGFGITRLVVRNPDFTASPVDFFTTVAAEAPRGVYPMHLLREQSHWTIVGAGDGDTHEALINEQGQIEVDHQGFSLEPFIETDGRLLTWNEGTHSQHLLKDYLPVPSVIREHPEGCRLTVTAFAGGQPGNSILFADYTLRNGSSHRLPGKLFITIRPFQVNPPSQSVEYVAGVARVDSIHWRDGRVHVQEKSVVPLTPPASFNAAPFNGHDIVERLRRRIIPTSADVNDESGFASGVLVYPFDLPPGGELRVSLAVPFSLRPQSFEIPGAERNPGLVDHELGVVTRYWESRLGTVRFTVPPSAQPIINTILSNIAWVLINRDGPRIQPGSRNYERSWIRDGSLTSTALLEIGVQSEVRQFIDWYSAFQFPGGKVPCMVDDRGGDGVPEHDSHGQLIHAIAQYFRFTADTAWLRGKWDNVRAAVRYISYLHSLRKTDHYRTGNADLRACYGLVPESISHEGYWGHPRHSYWDDFFVLLGLKDAVSIAEILGETSVADEFRRERDDTRKDLLASLDLTMKIRGIDYIPGCVELGDFDATSTTVAIDPCGELENLPSSVVRATFDRYYRDFVAREHNDIPWESYTPYENRVIGSFVRLGEKERAHHLVRYFMADRRPAGWNHWTEVVWRDPKTMKYIGDMPHTWCGTDFVRSIRSMFAFEREEDHLLVVGAGIPDEWIAAPGGVGVEGLPTWYGPLSFSMRDSASVRTISVGGIQAECVIPLPRERAVASVVVNGREKAVPTGHELRLSGTPATIRITFRQ